MKQRWTMVAWSVVYLLLLLSLATLLSGISAFFLIVPGIVLFVASSTKSFIIHVASALVAAAILIGPTVLILAAYFLVPSIVMGYLYKTRASALRTILIGAGTIVGEALLSLAFATLILDFNLANYIEDFVNNAIAPLQSITDPALTGGVIWPPDMGEQINNMLQLIPFVIIVLSLMISLITHLIVRPTLASMGQAVSTLPPLRQWRFPRSFIWYYLIGALIEMFAETAAREGFLGMIILNLMPLLQFFFMIQTASFFFYVAYHKKWNPVFPILIIPAMVLLPILWVIGIMDIAFPLRERITRSDR